MQYTHRLLSATAIALAIAVLPVVAAAQSSLLNEDGQRQCRALCPDLSDVACFQEKCAVLFDRVPDSAAPAVPAVEVRRTGCSTRGAHSLTVLDAPEGGFARIHGSNETGQALEVQDGDTIEVPDGYTVEVVQEGGGSFARMTLESGSVFTLFCADTAKVDRGLVRFVVNLLGGRDATIETRGAIAGIRGTTFTVDAHEGSRTTIAVEEGDVAVAARGALADERLITKGQTAQVANGVVSVADDAPEGAPTGRGAWYAAGALLAVVAFVGYRFRSQK